MHVSEWFLKTTFCDPGPDARFRLARILFVIVLYPFNAKKKLRNRFCRHCFSILQELIMKYFLNRIYNKEGLAILLEQD